jgi:hypothetical protein
MKLNWICGVLIAIALAIPASAQVGVYIGVAPPPLRHEARGTMPGPGYAWVDGYWSHPHYDHYKQGWQMHEGHWDHGHEQAHNH